MHALKPLPYPEVAKFSLYIMGKDIMSPKMIKTPEGARVKCKIISIQKCETMSHKSIVTKL